MYWVTRIFPIYIRIIRCTSLVLVHIIFIIPYRFLPLIAHAFDAIAIADIWYDGILYDGVIQYGDENRWYD